MPTLRINQKIILSLGMLLGLLGSFSITMISHNDLADSVTITMSILLIVGIISVVSTLAMDLLASICNP